MEGNTFQILAQFGLAGVIFGALFYILQWMMKLHDKVMTDSKEERKEWQIIIGALKTEINDMGQSNRLFFQQVTEAHRQINENICKTITALEKRGDKKTA